MFFALRRISDIPYGEGLRRKGRGCVPFPAGNIQSGQNLRMYGVESMDGTELSCGKRGKNRNHSI